MEFLASGEITGWLVIGASLIIIVAVLFAKFLKLILKVAIVAVMLVTILYFLVQLGVVEFGSF